MIKTHLAITLFFVLILMPFVSNKAVFIVFAILATFVPDIDSKNSKLGSKIVFRPLQWVFKHRGFIHSFSFLFILTGFLILILPQISLGVFVGFASHLLADSFTLEGIYPFYPLRWKASWKLKTGSVEESAIFVVLVILDFFLTIPLFS